MEVSKTSVWMQFALGKIIVIFGHLKGEELFFFQIPKIFKNKIQLVVRQPEMFLKWVYVVYCVD